jgi:hypothetical protein
MTRQEIHIQKLVQEANHRSLHLHTRRHFLKESAMGLGALAMGALFGSCGSKSGSNGYSIAFDPAHPMLPKPPQFPARAKNIIFLHMAGAPSQLELFDYKPELMKMHGQDCPPSSLRVNSSRSYAACRRCSDRRRNSYSEDRAAHG